MTSHMRLPHATPSCDSYVRTDGRTNEESWLRHIDHLQLRNAHAHIRIFPSADFHTDSTDAKEQQP